MIIELIPKSFRPEVYEVLFLRRESAKLFPSAQKRRAKGITHIKQFLKNGLTLLHTIN